MTKLISILKQPELAQSLSKEAWESLYLQAKEAQLLPQLAFIAQKLASQLPQNIKAHFESALILANAHQRAVHWELNRIKDALSATNTPVVLLKGAAYLAQSMPHSFFRLYGDVDILVPEDSISLVEEKLKWSGWSSSKTTPYDQKYYRQWMHEIPPLQHAKRGSTIDVHHRLLPKTARLTASGHPFIQSSSKLNANSTFNVLEEKDQLIHTAAHLFSDGETDHSLRDLFDMYQLIQLFSQSNPEYIKQTVERANDLGLSRWLYYALNFVNALFELNIDPSTINLCNDKPNKTVNLFFCFCFSRTLLLENTNRRSFSYRLAKIILFIRGHYLRMPMYLLIPHLIRKALSKESEH